MLEQKNNVKEKNDFKDFLIYFRRKIIYFIIPVILISALLSIYLFFIAQPVYEATAQMYVAGGSDSILSLANLEIGTYLASDYLKFFDLWEISQQVIDKLQLPYNIDEMQKNLTITNPSYTRILIITFSSNNAQESANVSNMYAKVIQEYIADHIQINAPVLISSAQVPQVPSRPNKIMILEWTLLVTAFLSMWCIYISFLMGCKIVTAKDIKECMGASPIAEIPICNQSRNKNK